MKHKIIFFDSGGVLIFGNPWVKLAEAVDMPLDLDQKWIDQYYDGRLTFQQWNANVENFYINARLDRKTFEKVLDFKNYTFNEEAAELIKYIRDKGYQTAIVSSDTDYFIGRIAKHYGIDIFKANCHFVFDESGLFKKREYISSDPEAKVVQINEVCKKLDINPEETIFIGDSINDSQAFQHTKHGIMYGNHPQLAKFAWKTVQDLREIIKILEE